MSALVAKTLTARQLDGLDCAYCGSSTPTMVPAGAVDGHQVFACDPKCTAKETTDQRLTRLEEMSAQLLARLARHLETCPAAGEGRS